MPPYQNIGQLPQKVKEELPQLAQERYLEAYNVAYEEERTIEGKRDKETAHEKAWERVKKEFPALKLA